MNCYLSSSFCLLLINNHCDVELDEALVDLYRKRARSEYDAGQTSYNHYRFTSGNAERLVQYSKTGVWEVKQPVKKHITSDYYEGLLLYISSKMAEDRNWKKRSKQLFEETLRSHFSSLFESPDKD